MNRDKIRHFYNIYDLQHLRDKTKAWIALSNNKLLGYMVEYDKRVLTMRGNEECTIRLLKNSDLTTPLFNIEPRHLAKIKRLYEPTEPVDQMTLGRITTFLTMENTQTSFTPKIQHRVQEVTKESAQAVSDLLGVDFQRTQDFLRGLAFGIFKRNKLVSFAASPEMLEDLAIIRGVQTALEKRNKGYATSVCSVLVERLHQQGKNVMLYVSKDNSPAIKVYRKIGFKETGHLFLSFTAKRK